MGHFAVQGQGFDGAVGLQHDGAAGGFIAAAGFHAHVAVFHDVVPAYAVGAANLVQGLQHSGGAHGHAIDGDDVAALKVQFDIAGHIGCGLGADAPAPHILFRFRPGALQHAALVGNM